MFVKGVLEVFMKTVEGFIGGQIRADLLIKIIKFIYKYPY